MMNTFSTPASESDPCLKWTLPRNRRACTSCSTRGAFCDALARNGLPCTNCNLENIRCEIVPRLTNIAPKPTTNPLNSPSTRRNRSGEAPKKRRHVEISANTAQATENGQPSFPGVNSVQDSRSQQHASTNDRPNLDPTSQPDEVVFIVSSSSSSVISVDTGNDQHHQKPLDIADIPDMIASTPSHAVHPDLLTLDVVDDVRILFPDPHCGITDSEILRQYMKLTDVFNPYSSDHHSSPAAQSESNQRQGHYTHPKLPARDKTSLFRSPLPWVADWSTTHLEDDDSWFAVVEEKVFNLPSHSEIRALIRIYFTYAHHRLPILRERDFYSLTNQNLPENINHAVAPISLALLYAVMFTACPYLATESSSNLIHSNIRAKRCEYYSRAALLFKLGCEADPLRKIQICLLLSTYRSHPTSHYENDRWIIAAYRMLDEVGVLPFNRIPNSPDSSAWKRVTTCWMLRFTGLLVGLKWTSNMELTAALSCSWTEISLDDFEDDCNFSWYLSAEVKQHLSRIFLASVALHTHMGALGRLLVKCTATEMEAMELEQRSPVLGKVSSIEEIELGLEDWKSENALIMDAEPPPSLRPPDASIYRVDQIILKLAYEYIMSTLYQSTLIIRTNKITKWAARVIEASRAALRESVLRTVKILRTIVVRDYVHLLPSKLMVFVMIPLTICHLHAKRTVHFNHSAIENLSICTGIIQKLTERFDVGHFFCELLGKSLELAEHYQRQPLNCVGMNPSSVPSRSAPSNSRGTVSRAEQNLFLPEPDLHSRIIRFQNMALSLGSMPSLEMVTRQR